MADWSWMKRLPFLSVRNPEDEPELSKAETPGPEDP